MFACDLSDVIVYAQASSLICLLLTMRASTAMLPCTHVTVARLKPRNQNNPNSVLLVYGSGALLLLDPLLNRELA